MQSINFNVMYGPDLDLCLITILNECCLHILCGPACDVNIDDPHGRYRSEPSGADVPAPSSPRCKIPDGGNAESAQGLGGSSVLLIPVSSLLFIPSIFPTAHYLPLMLLSTSTVPLERQRYYVTVDGTKSRWLLQDKCFAAFHPSSTRDSCLSASLYYQARCRCRQHTSTSLMAIKLMCGCTLIFL